MREFGKTDREPSKWKRFLKSLASFFTFNWGRGTMADHDERMKKRRRKTKFDK